MTLHIQEIFLLYNLESLFCFIAVDWISYSDLEDVFLGLPKLIRSSTWLKDYISAMNEVDLDMEFSLFHMEFICSSS